MSSIFGVLLLSLFVSRLTCARTAHRLHFIDRHVARGSHYVECQLLGEEDDRNVPPFKIIGIFST